MDATSIFNNFREQFPGSGYQNYKAENDPSTQVAITHTNALIDRETQNRQSVMQANEIIKAEAEAKLAAAEARATASRSQDAGKRRLNAAGGYEFLDGNGRPISPAEWASDKGVSVSSALEGSIDPGDIQFIHHSRATEMDVAQHHYDAGTGMKQLQQAFPHIFGLSGADNIQGMDDWRHSLGNQDITSEQNDLADQVGGINNIKYAGQPNPDQFSQGNAQLGGWEGVGAGALAGSIFGPIGTGVGGIVGGIAGYMGGGNLPSILNNNRGSWWDPTTGGDPIPEHANPSHYEDRLYNVLGQVKGAPDYTSASRAVADYLTNNQTDLSNQNSGSDSTGKPKTVFDDHKRILMNSLDGLYRYEPTKESLSGSSYPPLDESYLNKIF